MLLTAQSGALPAAFEPCIPAILSYTSSMLTDPAFSFTIPSIEDDTELECRIYHRPEPTRRSRTSHFALPWHKRGAIVAHPYAPLGGCADDPVVELVAGELLAQSFVVGTFNFRYLAVKLYNGAVMAKSLYYIVKRRRRIQRPDQLDGSPRAAGLHLLHWAAGALPLPP